MILFGAEVEMPSVNPAWLGAQSFSSRAPNIAKRLWSRVDEAAYARALEREQGH